ncbi:MAG: hypothetical protein WCW26_00920 [Candidatus Buchananbacteria bacterium]
MMFEKRDTVFHGQEAINLSLPGMELIVLKTFLRIVHLGPNLAQNLLYIDTDRKFMRGQWVLYGGHRIWFGLPGADEHHGAYTPDAGPIEVKERLDGNIESIVFTAPPDAMQIVKGFVIRPLADGLVEVENFVANGGDMLAAGGVWPITCTNPVSTEAFYVTRLNTGNPGWDAPVINHFPTWGGGHQTSAEGDGQFSRDIINGQWLHTLRPEGLEAKRAFTSAFGAQAMVMPKLNLTLFKIAPPFDHRQPYLIPGCNAAMYAGPYARTENAGPAMVEMEDVGPAVQLYPGESVSLSVLFSLATQAIVPAECDFSPFNRENFLKSLPR